jgi:hypothetical protein
MSLLPEALRALELALLVKHGINAGIRIRI